MSQAAEGAVGRLSMKDEVAALKRRHTVDAAVDLFYANGYENTTLDAVAERLGVSKPFIYANFGSKAELLAEICARAVAVAHEAIDGVLALGLPPAEALETFARRYVATILENQKHIAVYVREDKNLDPAEGRRIGLMRRDFFAKIRALLEAGAAAGEFEIGDSQIAALAIGGAVTWSTFWYRPDGRLSVDEIAGRMSHAILRLAGLPQGR
jgi:AcrR family transcriptional regulator